MKGEHKFFFQSQGSEHNHKKRENNEKKSINHVMAYLDNDRWKTKVGRYWNNMEGIENWKAKRRLKGKSEAKQWKILFWKQYFRFLWSIMKKKRIKLTCCTNSKGTGVACVNASRWIPCTGSSTIRQPMSNHLQQNVRVSHCVCAKWVMVNR